MTDFKWSEDPMRGLGVLQQAQRNERLAARAQKAEAERDDVMRHVEKMMLRTEAAEARAEKAEARLQEVVDKVAEQRLAGYRELGQRVAEAENRLDSERARADRYLAAITEYVQATADEEQAEKVYASFGRRMLDRTLPPVTEEDVKAAFTTVANARNRAYAATTAIRAIVEEARK